MLHVHPHNYYATDEMRRDDITLVIPCKKWLYNKRRRKLSLERIVIFSLWIVLLYLPLPSSARLLPAASVVVSYTTMLGLAAHTTKLKHAMEGELEIVAKKSAQAGAWEEAAVEDQSASDALTKKSMAEQEEADILQEEAESLLAKGEADEAKAATTEGEADGLAAQAGESEVQSTAFFAQAAAEEVVVEEDVAKATADATLAAEDGSAAEADEATTAFCQFIPFVDVLCDVVGGIAAVGLETLSVRSAVLAVQEYAAAAAAQLEVDSTTAEATDLQAAAVEEGEEAGGLHSAAAELEMQATEELEEGQADEAAAEEQLSQSVADKEAAVEEEAKAAAEADASAKAWSESMQHGANACGKSIMMSIFSAVACLFWTTRIAGAVVVPVLKSVSSALWTLLTAPGRTPRTETISVAPQVQADACEFLPATSHTFLHGLFFVLFFGLWGDSLLQLRNLASIQAMGGTILGFAACVAGTQIMLLHALPKAYNEWSLWAGIREFFRWSFVLCPLVVMEILLVWVNAGKWAFAPTVVQWTQSWVIWVVLGATIIIHYGCLAGSKRRGNQLASLGSGEYHELNVDDLSMQRLLTPSDQEEAVVDYGSRTIVVEEIDSEKWESIEISENESETRELLLSTRSTLNVQATQSTTKENSGEKFILRLIMDDIARLRLVLVFEVLMASVMLALLRQSTPTLRNLWPASKAILLSAYPNWHLMIVLFAAATILVLVCACF